MRTGELILKNRDYVSVSVWVRNLVSDNKEGTETEGV
jgi:hypothetical protein